MIENEKAKIWIESLIARKKNEEQVEENKLELKREWYKFKEGDSNQRKITESEFLKDIVAIANTVGPEGYLIIGIDEKGNVFDSKLTNSGLKDQVELRSIIVKNVDRPFIFDFQEIEYFDNGIKKIISIISIPPSLEKPHVIGEFRSKNNIQNYIPVRKNTSIWPANKYDLELMYYDRKNIEPEYALDFLLANFQLRLSRTSNSVLPILFQVAFQSFGRKPIAIIRLMLKIIPNDVLKYFPELSCDLNSYSDREGHYDDNFIKRKPIIISSNQIAIYNCRFNCNCSPEVDAKLNELKESKEYKFSISAVDILDNKYPSKSFEPF